MNIKKRCSIRKGLIFVSAFVLCSGVAVTGVYADSVKGRDVWVVDGKEMHELPEELEDELRKDPIVKAQLGLGDAEGQPNGDFDELEEKLEDELRKDPIVKAQLGLGDAEGQPGGDFDIKDESDNLNKEDPKENTENSTVHIASIDGADIRNVLISGENLGVVIEKSPTDNFEFDYVGVGDVNNFSFTHKVNSNGTLTITISANSSVNYIHINPDNKVNVVNVKVPEKIYDSFTLNIQKGALCLPVIKGNVHVDSEKSLVKIAADHPETNLNLNLKESKRVFVKN